MKKLNGLFIAFAISSTIYAQQNTDTVKVLDAVVVTGIKKEVLRHTPFNVTVLPASHLQNSINYSISDALAKLPGISQISTGVGISKPVIRGLYGNRIQTVLLGLRFDNQQWQDEHGLGLSIIGIDRIEVLKGPSSLLYGTEAMGGVIRIIEEAPADSNTKVSDINTQLYSNTYGLSVNGGIKATKNNRSWRIRLGMDSHADYADGNNNRVLNSRFSSYNAKASYGYIRKNWMNQNHIYTSFSKFGFIMEDNRDRKPVDARISRKMDGPNHSVFFTLLSSENSIALNNSRLELNGGVHTNLRLENEGGNRISLNMLLNTFSYNVRWFKPLTASWEFIAGNETQYQTNTNYGSRVIIPDAHLTESAVSVYIKKKGIVDVESGISLSERNITTFYTQNLNYTNNNIQPFSRWYASFNGNAG
ncbi:MAG: TonB-dependent receptor plug domain-containing protein, partial [Flavisolibacter sp.]|nr:TonB-dependent receptor plug domain-containing protein [Flavisolibacter sp.]